MKSILFTIILISSQAFTPPAFATDPEDSQCAKELVNPETTNGTEDIKAKDQNVVQAKKSPRKAKAASASATKKTQKTVAAVESDETVEVDSTIDTKVDSSTQANTVAKAEGSTPEAKADIHQVYSKFKAYFEAVNETTLERDQVVYISQLALLAKEHVLLMGPPGTAKSQLAESILKAIKADKGNGFENSYYKIQMTPETTLSETHGPINYNELNQSGRQVRFYDEGMLKSHGVFIDEIFDSRANAKRNILGLINEREHAQGPNIEEGHIHTVIAATNKYLSEVYEEAGNDGPKALVDRFAFSVFIPGGLEYTGSILQIIKKAGKTKTTLPDLTYDDINLLREQINNIEIPDQVALFLELLSNNLKIQTEALEQASLKEYLEKKADGEHPAPPYRATKYHSARTTGKAAGILKAIVLLDWLESGGTRSLTVSLEDIKKLEVFYTLNGPSDEFLDETLSLTTNDHEKRQLMNIKQERKIFRKLYQKFADEINDNIVQFALTDLQTEMADDNLSEEEKQELAKKLSALAIQSHISPTEMLRKNAISPKIIAKILAHGFATQALEDLMGKEQAEASLKSSITELEKAKEAALAKKQEFEKQVQEKVYELAQQKAKQNLISELQAERKDEQLKIIERKQFQSNFVYANNGGYQIIRPQVVNGKQYFIARSSTFFDNSSTGTYMFSIDQNDNLEVHHELNAVLTESKKKEPIAINKDEEIVVINDKFLDTYDLNGADREDKTIVLNKNDEKFLLIYEPKHKNKYLYNFENDSFKIYREDGSEEVFESKDSNTQRFSYGLAARNTNAEFYAGTDPNTIYYHDTDESFLYRIKFKNGKYKIKSLLEDSLYDTHIVHHTTEDNDSLYRLHRVDDKLVLTVIDLNNETSRDIELPELQNEIEKNENLTKYLYDYNFWYNPETERLSFSYNSNAYVFNVNSGQFIVKDYTLRVEENSTDSDTLIEYQPNKFIRAVVSDKITNVIVEKYILNLNDLDLELDTNRVEAATQDILQQEAEALRVKAIESLTGKKADSKDDISDEQNQNSENTAKLKDDSDFYKLQNDGSVKFESIPSVYSDVAYLETTQKHNSFVFRSSNGTHNFPQQTLINIDAIDYVASPPAANTDQTRMAYVIKDHLYFKNFRTGTLFRFNLRALIPLPKLGLENAEDLVDKFENVIFIDNDEFALSFKVNQTYVYLPFYISSINETVLEVETITQFADNNGEDIPAKLDKLSAYLNKNHSSYMVPPQDSMTVSAELIAIEKN